MIVRRYQDADVRTLRRRKWQRDYQGIDLRELEAESAVVGGVAAARSSSDAIFVGVTTGVLVWAITNVLNRMFFGGGK